MNGRRDNYLRTHRRKSALTQRELAFLLGCTSGAKVSRYERLARKPNLETAFACQAVFGIPPHELFPGAYATVELLVIERTHLLLGELNTAEPSSRTDHKVRVLRRIVARKSNAR